MLTGQELLLLQVRMDWLYHRFVRLRSRRCCHMGDQVRAVFVAGLAQMDLISDPGRAPLFAVACLAIIRRTDIASRRWNILITAPAQLALLIEVILDPDLTQDLDGWDLTEQLWRSRIKNSCQQRRAVSANQFCQGLTLSPTRGQARLLDAMAIAIQPLLLTMSKQPVTSDNGQTVESKPHGFTHTHESIDGANLGQDVGGISALLLPLLEPAALFEQGQHGIKQHLLRSPLDQTRAKVRQDAKVKAGVDQFQTQSILQVDPPAHCVRGLSIGQSLDELYDCNECKSPGSLNRASILWKHMGKGLILINRSQGIAHVHI